MFTISVLTENKSGILNAVTIIFTRRKMNIQALNVSETEIEGVSRITVVINTVFDKAEQVVKQINKLIEVLGAFLYREDEVYYQEIALFKMGTGAFLLKHIFVLMERKSRIFLLLHHKQ